MGNRRLSAIVHGHVQGVNFRWHTRRHATELGLTGWVRNLPGRGGVKVLAEGDPSQLADLILFLHTGPPAAVVETIEVNWEEATGEFKDFGIRFL